ncbi:MAG: transposase [Pisciglobus halotolerans]|nr:transposase [Pisciglobus halotolerans]
MLRKQVSKTPSPYSQLYDILVPQNHTLRRMKELVDFSFIYEEVKENYTVDFGRNAADPVYMFKLLLLKVMYPLSDRDLCERARYDMSFKYFLDLSPEEDIIHPSLLSKFRTQRLKNSDLLELVLRRSIQVAKEQNIPLGDTIIVDATHTNARFQFHSPLEILRKQTSLLRKSCYRVDESVKTFFPTKNTFNDIQEELLYTTQLLEVIEKNQTLTPIPDINEKLHLTKEMIEDFNNHLAISTSNDPDARIGHKSADSSFFGFKSHLAMTENGLITGLVVTSGEQPDGKYLPDLIEYSNRNGIEVRTVIGDAAYSGKDNLEKCDNDTILLIAKLNPSVSKGNRRKEDEFFLTKILACLSVRRDIKQSEKLGPARKIKKPINP